MTEQERFINWVDGNFSDHSWYLDAKKKGMLHAYRPDLDDYWCYDETLMWLAWSSAKRQAARQKESSALVPVAYMTAHPMFFPTYDEAVVFCAEDEEPIALYEQAAQEPQVRPTSVKIYDQLLGLTFRSVKQDSNDELVFECDDGRLFTFTHVQDCCEDVQIEDICGDLQDLVGNPLLQAEEVTYSDANPADVPSKDYQDSFTWTFYKFATIKGSVTVRWYGTSNGYYSESVDLYESKKEQT